MNILIDVYKRQINSCVCYVNGFHCSAAIGNGLIHLGISGILHCKKAVRIKPVSYTHLFENGFIMLAFKMVNPHFYILETGSENHIVVLGKYLLFSDENAELICASK